VLAAGLIVLTFSAQAVEVSGKSYFQYAYENYRPEEDYNSMDVGRVYLSFKDTVEENIKFKATTDIHRDIDGYYRVFLKYCQLTFEDLVAGADVSIGQLATPQVGFEEKAWGYRFVSKSFSDLDTRLSSADQGISARRELADGFGEMVIAVLNGEGYHKAERNKYKDLNLRLSIKPFKEGERLGGLTASAFFQGGFDYRADQHTVAIAMLSYGGDAGALGVEGIAVSEQAGMAGQLVRGQGLGAFWAIKLSGKVKLIGRAETFDPTLQAAYDEYNRFINGLAYKVAERLEFAIDNQQEVYRDASRGGSNTSYLHCEVKY